MANIQELEQELAELKAKFAEFVHGDENTTVVNQAGAYPSFAKAINDNIVVPNSTAASSASEATAKATEATTAATTAATKASEAEEAATTATAAKSVAVAAFQEYGEPTAWAPDTAYTKDAVMITVGNLFYVPTETHTSGGSFSADLIAGKWRLHKGLDTKSGLVRADNADELRALIPSFLGQTVSLAGKTVAGVGGGTYVSKFGASPSDDGVRVIVVNDGSGYYWELVGVGADNDFIYDLDMSALCGSSNKVKRIKTQGDIELTEPASISTERTMVSEGAQGTTYLKATPGMTEVLKLDGSRTNALAIGVRIGDDVYDHTLDDGSDDFEVNPEGAKRCDGIVTKASTYHHTVTDTRVVGGYKAFNNRGLEGKTVRAHAQDAYIGFYTSNADQYYNNISSTDCDIGFWSEEGSEFNNAHMVRARINFLLKSGQTPVMWNQAFNDTPQEVGFDITGVRGAQIFQAYHTKVGQGSSYSNPVAMKLRDTEDSLFIGSREYQPDVVNQTQAAFFDMDATVRDNTFIGYRTYDGTKPELQNRHSAMRENNWMGCTGSLGRYNNIERKRRYQFSAAAAVDGVGGTSTITFVSSDRALSSAYLSALYSFKLIARASTSNKVIADGVFHVPIGGDGGSTEALMTTKEIGSAGVIDLVLAVQNIQSDRFDIVITNNGAGNATGMISIEFECDSKGGLC
ncbi:hypothetical protein [Neptunomonas phycophila]|uniref:hypothetical protein n=1 Tax=Neptunomonas phycophila TaxID=1572645 RepID=UPI0037357308